ncbi:MAG: D-Ala-D-Ala carboxypeptidase family metallohydrolase [Parabacteroides sp.]
MNDTHLTPHFRLSEFTRSQTAEQAGIDNRIPESLIPHLVTLCEQVLEPLRQHAGKPIVISSGYRCPRLNALVGGVPHSQHLTGEAADLHLPSLTEGREWFRWIATRGSFDQLLWERKGTTRWIHVSCRSDPKKNRKEVLTVNA